MKTELLFEHDGQCRGRGRDEGQTGIHGNFGADVASDERGADDCGTATTKRCSWEEHIDDEHEACWYERCCVERQGA